MSFDCGSVFQSTRPVWGATGDICIQRKSSYISIHAPRVGRDTDEAGLVSGQVISIHAPRVGRDLPVFPPLFAGGVISIHAPRVGRDGKRAEDGGVDCISIHAPRVGRDDRRAAAAYKDTIFQSTRPVWGATVARLYTDSTKSISIHAPRVGRDSSDNGKVPTVNDFNPRAPCGARQMTVDRATAEACLFQSTRPVWGATAFDRLSRTDSGTFQSTRPVWGATKRP